MNKLESSLILQHAVTFKYLYDNIQYVIPLYYVEIYINFKVLQYKESKVLRTVAIYR